MKFLINTNIPATGRWSAHLIHTPALLCMSCMSKNDSHLFKDDLIELNTFYFLQSQRNWFSQKIFKKNKERDIHSNVCAAADSHLISKSEFLFSPYFYSLCCHEGIQLVKQRILLLRMYILNVRHIGHCSSLFLYGIYDVCMCARSWRAIINRPLYGALSLDMYSRQSKCPAKVFGHFQSWGLQKIKTTSGEMTMYKYGQKERKRERSIQELCWPTWRSFYP